MSEIDYPEDFIPIAAGIKRLPYLSPRPAFADRVMSKVARASSANAAAPVVPTRPQLDVIRGGGRAVTPRPAPYTLEHTPDSALVRARRRRLLTIAVGVPATIGVLIAVSVLFAQLDLLAAFLGAAGAQAGTVGAIIGTSAGNLVFGNGAMAVLEAGTAEAAFLYIAMALGLIAGYSGIRVAAEIARRKAA